MGNRWRGAWPEARPETRSSADVANWFDHERAVGGDTAGAKVPMQWLREELTTQTNAPVSDMIVRQCIGLRAPVMNFIALVEHDRRWDAGAVVQCQRRVFPVDR